MTAPPPPEGRHESAGTDGMQNLLTNLKDIFARGREEIVRNARVGRLRLDLHQMRKDRDDLLRRLGATTFELLSRGELRHGELVPTRAAIEELDRRVQALERDVSALVQEEALAEVRAAQAPGASEGAPSWADSASQWSLPPVVGEPPPRPDAAPADVGPTLTQRGDAEAAAAEHHAPVTAPSAAAAPGPAVEGADTQDPPARRRSRKRER